MGLKYPFLICVNSSGCHQGQGPVGCCFLLKLEYYSSENLLKFIYNKTLISLA